MNGIRYYGSKTIVLIYDTRDSSNPNIIVLLQTDQKLLHKHHDTALCIYVKDFSSGEKISQNQVWLELLPPKPQWAHR